MHQSIYQFLLESGYSRASIVTELWSMEPGHRADPATAAKTSSGRVQTGSQSTQQLQVTACYPSFLIVDPESYDQLAVFDVVESGSASAVAERGAQISLYAGQFVDQFLLSYVIQIDVHNVDPEQQVRFYKVSSPGTLVPLSAYSFPDLEALKVRRMMEMSQRYPRIVDDSTAYSGHAGQTAYADAQRGLRVVYSLAGFTVLILLIDWLLSFTRGSGLLSTQQTILLGIAVVLLAIPNLLRLQRQ